MPRVVAYEDVRARQNKTRGRVRTDFFDASGDTPESPMAYLHQGDPGRVTGTHWHANDQFQIVVEGGGKLGRHPISPYTVQFVRAYTPYGPLVGSGDSGLTYVSLLTRYDPRANYLPDTREMLEQVPDRKPWQVIRQLKFPSQGGSAAPGPVDLQEIPGIKDDKGLLAWTLTMAPNAKGATPDASHSEGQYVLVVKGSLWHGNRDHKAFTVVYVERESSPFLLQAGPTPL